MDLNDSIIVGIQSGEGAEILRRYQDAEVYFPLRGDFVTEGSAHPEIVGGNRIDLQTANLEDGKMALFYASRDDARLGDRFAGVPLAIAARMVCNEQAMDGLLLQGSADAWVCFPKQKLLKIIVQLRDRVAFKNFR